MRCLIITILAWASLICSLAAQEPEKAELQVTLKKQDSADIPPSGISGLAVKIVHSATGQAVSVIRCEEGSDANGLLICNAACDAK